MGKQEKVLERLANPSQDANWNFNHPTGLLQRMDWEMRVKGSHRFFRKTGEKGTGTRTVLNFGSALPSLAVYASPLSV